MPKAIYADKAALDAVTPASNKVTAAATAATPANLSTTGVAAGTYQVYAVDAAGNVSSASSDINIQALTANITLDLTSPTDDPSNTISGVNTKTVAVNVVNTTASVVLTGGLSVGQTVVVGGIDGIDVIQDATASTAPTFTVDTSSVAAAGGSKTFTLTVKETGKADIVYNVTVTVANQ